MTIGIIEEGRLQGKRLIVEPRKGLPDNLYLVEKGTFVNGAPMYTLHCLISGCEEEVPGNCLKHN